MSPFFIALSQCPKKSGLIAWKNVLYRVMKLRKGFSIIELIITVAVVAILAVLYISSTGDLSNVSIDAASRKVQSDLRYTQHLATTTGVNHGAVFTANVGYEVYQGSPGNPVIDPVTRQNLVVNLAEFQGVTVSTNYQVEFSPVGEPIMGGDGRVRLTSSSGATRDVYVVDKTGAVIIDLIGYGTGCQCKLCIEDDEK